ncbi:hypothetical protein ILUMI_22216 [Ignelater luminosus]|uniref:Protein-lysine N-methyltransferase ILUMI_22216 n=1 Tax=Ignelater luminosus TaxID=2038154 RepID=A0A8K0CB15_IGNLU|nr:hypothetical protein ILUMI_22216 [Ignelater luminosus]
MSFEELGECELGTQEYWDKLYKTEISNFRNHKDVGEVWFGEDIADRIVRWMNKNVPKESVIVDLGCGNGMLLVDLFNGGFKNLNGIDYSEDAVVLAKEVSDHCGTSTEYFVKDILKDNLGEEHYDVVLDKGTYDAISLTSDARHSRETYIDNVHKCLKDDGLLVITSCNWTKDELCTQFEDKFKIFDVIPTPQFKFGGKIGSVVSSVVFKKNIIL